jgi:polysaccharide pyruvyl transferase WcaK-like protein
MIIGLMGPFGYGNLGDAATQDAAIQNIRRRFPHAQLRGYSLNPEDTTQRHGIESFPITRQSWKRERNGSFERLLTAIIGKLGGTDKPALHSVERWLMRVPLEQKLIVDTFHNLAGVDLLVISGGGQIEDYWGGGGPWSYPYTLLKWCVAAKLSGARIAIMSVGAGPIQHPLSKLFLRLAISLADYRSYRDAFSRDLVHSIGVSSDHGVFPDLAFSLDLPSVDETTPRSAATRTIAIGPIGYLRPDFWPEQDAEAYERYAQKMVAFIRHLLQRGDSIVFVPGEAHYDQQIIGDLLQRLAPGERSAPRLRRPAIASVADLVSELAQVDYVVGSRFHNLVLAHMLQKPTLALSYQNKIDSLMSAAGQASFCFDVATFDVHTLIQHLDLLEEHAAEIKATLTARCTQYRAELDHQYGNMVALIESG